MSDMFDRLVKMEVIKAGHEDLVVGWLRTEMANTHVPKSSVKEVMRKWALANSMDFREAGSPSKADTIMSLALAALVLESE
jgi:hypothetical protein